MSASGIACHGARRRATVVEEILRFFSYDRGHRAPGVPEEIPYKQGARLVARLLGETTATSVVSLALKSVCEGRTRCFQNKGFSRHLLPAVVEHFLDVQLKELDMQLLAPVVAQSATSATSTALVVHEEASAAIIQYETAPAPELRQMVLLRDSQLEDKQATIRSLRKTTCKLEKRNAELQRQLAAVKKDTAAQLALVNFRPGLRNCSLFGGYSMATRYCKAGLAGRGTAVALMAGPNVNGGFSDPKVLARFEHRALMGVRLAARDLYTEVRSEAFVGIGIGGEAAEVRSEAFVGGGIGGEAAPRRMRFQVHAYMGDATNQAAIGLEKIHQASVTTIAAGAAQVHKAMRSHEPPGGSLHQSLRTASSQLLLLCATRKL